MTPSDRIATAVAHLQSAQRGLVSGDLELVALDLTLAGQAVFAALGLVARGRT